jgi:hypothetical protein
MRFGVIVLACAATAAHGEKLRPETQAAFERYIRQAEARIETQVSRSDGFLTGSAGQLRERLRSGAVWIESRSGAGEFKPPHGLIHDWMGAVFLPGATLRGVLDLVQAYDRHKQIYQPEVIDSRQLWRDGNDYRVRLRVRKHRVRTVVLDTVHEIHYQRRSDLHWTSHSRSVSVSEIRDPGKPTEKALPPGTGNGYLWQLNSYWNFVEADGGTYVEIEAISLSRDVPAGLSWLITSIIRTLPRESLENTLHATQAALARPAGAR